MSKGEALYEAVRKGSIEAVENFLSERALDVNKMYEQGQETLLSAAVRKGSVGLIEILIGHGANVDTATPTKTAMHVAGYSGDLRVAKCLVGHGADIHVTDETDRTALQWAVKGGHSQLFQYLVEQKAEINRVAADGNTLLHDAMLKCSSEFIFELIDKQFCDVDGLNNAGETPLFLAASAGKVDVMQKLIALGSDVNVVSKNSETLLHVAAHNGHLNVAQFLIETMTMGDAYINKLTGEDCFATINKITTPTELWTALHFACAFGHMDIVRYLLGNGSNRSLRTRDGLKPIEICKAYKQRHLVSIFEDRRASHMPDEEMPTEEQLRMRRKTMPATQPGWKFQF